MKVTIVGGSAPSTAHLASEVRDVELALVGRDPAHIDAVVRASAVLAREGVRVHGFAGDDALIRALPGSDIVILQARYGGIAAREYDETFPLAFGIPGDEGLGPGGLASAWRSWPHLRDALSAIAQQAPGAFVVLMTAPLGILTIAARKRFPSLHLAGLCELPYVTLADACARANVQPFDTRFSYAGVNHLGVFDDVVTAAGEQLGPLRLKYFRLHHDADAVVAEQRSRGPRARTVGTFARRAYECFRDGNEAEIRDVLARRDAPWYRCAVGPLIEGMKPNASRDALAFLTTTNESYLPQLPSDTVLERPFIVRSGTMRAVERWSAASAETIDLVRRFAHFERLAAYAVLRRSESGIAGALRAHPWVGAGTDVDALAHAVRAPVPESAAAR